MVTVSECLAYYVFSVLQKKPTSAAYGRFFLSASEMLQLIGHASALLAREPSLLEISGEAKLYGDLHGMGSVCFTYTNAQTWIALTNLC